MAKRLNRILLIDDSDSDNFLHSRTIRKADVANEVIALTSAAKALEYLSTDVEGEYPRPDLIFLDVNMPGMNGWEFLEEYAKLDEEKRSGVMTIMLSTLYTDRHDRQLKKHPIVAGYLSKPLKREKLLEIVDKYNREREEEE